MTYTDDIAIKALKNSDKKAFTWIYNKYIHKLCFYAEKIAENMETAEDIVHDLFEKLWDNRNELAINSSLKSYLYNSIRNNYLSYLTHKKVIRNHIEYTLTMEDSDSWQRTTDNENPLSILISKEIKSETGKAIEALPARCKEVFLLWEEGFSYKEIAEESGITLGSVRAQITRAKNKLRESIKNI